MLGEKTVFCQYFRDPPKFHKSCFEGSSCLIKGGWDPPGSPVVSTLCATLVELHYLSNFCGLQTPPHATSRGERTDKMQKSDRNISQKGCEQRNGLWSPPAEPLLYCLANCLSFPPVVCFICTTAGETDSQLVSLPNSTGWFHRSVIWLGVTSCCLGVPFIFFLAVYFSLCGLIMKPHIVLCFWPQVLPFFNKLMLFTRLSIIRYELLQKKNRCVYMLLYLWCSSETLPPICLWKPWHLFCTLSPHSWYKHGQHYP